MKRLMMLGAMIALFSLGTAVAFAAASDAPPSPPGQSGNDQVCPEGDSGKINVSGSNASITVTAPEGKLISGYCVKAGSESQGLGPEFYTVDPPAKTVTITHSSGKDISHYSLTFIDEGTHTETHPTETHPTETTSTETTPTESTPDPASPPDVQPGVFTPPTSAKPTTDKPTTDKPAAVAGVVVTATTPTKAPQAAPFTP
ncbi:MAG TPA: hypothetical protein VMN35_06305 [Gaiellaceae bacterium]|nr:hypothetical protein [Gaiellaceae bacterium]